MVRFCRVNVFVDPSCGVINAVSVLCRNILSCNKFGTNKNRIRKKPCKFEQEMLSHKRKPWFLSRVGHLLLHKRKPCHGLVSDATFPAQQCPNRPVIWSVLLLGRWVQRGGSRVTCWLVRSKIRELVVAGLSTCEELFLRWQEERRRGPCCRCWDSLVYLFPASILILPAYWYYVSSRYTILCEQPRCEGEWPGRIW